MRGGAGLPVAGVEELDFQNVRFLEQLVKLRDAGQANCLLFLVQVGRVLADQFCGVAGVDEADGAIVRHLAVVSGEVVAEGWLGLDTKEIVQLKPAVLSDGVYRAQGRGTGAIESVAERSGDA